MLLILLSVTVSYFIIIAKLRREQSIFFKKPEEKNSLNSFSKMIKYIFEVCNKVSLTLLAVLLVYRIMENMVSEYEKASSWNVEILLWFIFMHFFTITFFCGLLELFLLGKAVKEEDNE